MPAVAPPIELNKPSTSLASRAGLAIPVFPLGIASIVAIAVLLRVTLGEYIREDAYITLRYARNIAEGQGFVFNQGEHVLGTTTPLFTLLVAVLTAFGVSPPTAAVTLAIASDAVAIILLAAICLPLLGRSGASLAALCYALLSPVVSWAVSGMETSFYTMLIVASTLAYARRKTRLCAFLCGLLVVTRPDGVILVVLLSLHAFFSRPRGWRAAAIVFAATVAPWMVFATAYFGSPVPQSMLAKLNSIPEDPFASLRHLVWYFTDLENRFFLPLSVVFLIGIIRRKRGLGVSLLYGWATTYCLLFILGNKFSFPAFPFEWYFVPLLAPFSIGVAAGLTRLVSSAPAIFRRNGLHTTLLATTALAFTIGYIAVLQRQHHDLDQMVSGREIVYAKLAQRMAEIGVQDEVVAAYEIGAFGYNYPGPILDLWGLVSPSVVGIDSAEIIESRRPAWIMTYADMLPDRVTRSTWFNREYKPFYALGTWEGRRATLFRRFPPADESKPPAVMNVLAANLELLSVDLAAKRLDQGKTALAVTLTWRPLGTLDRRYTFFVHLRDGANKLLAQDDGEPQGNQYPTTRWKPGETVVDRHDLVVAADAVAGDSVLVIGAYETNAVEKLLLWAAPSVADWPHELRFPLRSTRTFP